jgi:hypothetical protein
VSGEGSLAPEASGLPGSRSTPRPSRVETRRGCSACREDTVVENAAPPQSIGGGQPGGCARCVDDGEVTRTLARRPAQVKGFVKRMNSGLRLSGYGRARRGARGPVRAFASAEPRAPGEAVRDEALPRARSPSNPSRVAAVAITHGDHRRFLVSCGGRSPCTAMQPLVFASASSTFAPPGTAGGNPKHGDTGHGGHGRQSLRLNPRMHEPSTPPTVFSCPHVPSVNSVFHVSAFQKS